MHKNKIEKTFSLRGYKNGTCQSDNQQLQQAFANLRDKKQKKDVGRAAYHGSWSLKIKRFIVSQVRKSRNQKNFLSLQIFLNIMCLWNFEYFEYKIHTHKNHFLQDMVEYPIRTYSNFGGFRY